MTKLTAERAQERIAHLKQWQQQRGLTLREEEYLEALQISAGVLSAAVVDTAGLTAATEIMRLLEARQLGGLVQLKAQIQCLVIEAINEAKNHG